MEKGWGGALPLNRARTETIYGKGSDSDSRLNKRTTKIISSVNSGLKARRMQSVNTKAESLPYSLRGRRVRAYLYQRLVMDLRTWRLIKIHDSLDAVLEAPDG